MKVSSGVPTACKESQIPAVLTEHSDLITNLENLVCDLEQRLAPILGYLDKDPEPKNPMPEPVLVPLACTVRENSIRVAILGKRISDIIQRIEL